ncbi:glycosyltransferase family 4 protein [Pseudomonas sp. BF-R-19]|uniref:glycosyltransferase family 4 protein n=1 Tax=Pseudomonas sp. BF-R-19 TaxID=2832397 RepID=UPI001CBDBD7E|nr:glycosyltransferase family 4 protein [Pseudomonas sp. BF-R-19]
MSKSKKLILMIGPHILGKGGISSVINNYKASGLFVEENISYISTWIEGSFIRRQIHFLLSILKILIKFTTCNVKVIHIHVAQRGSFYRKALIIRISKLFSVPVILHLHASEFDKFYGGSNNFLQSIIRSILAKCDVIICLSESWAHYIKQIQPIAKTQILNNYVVPIKPKPSTPKIYDLLFLGRIGARKGLFDLLDVIRNDLDHLENIKIAVGGDGDVDELFSYINSNNLQKQVEYVGWITGEQKEQLIHSSRFVILPSYGEGMPMSLLEAMSAGVPIIATNVGGIPSLITHGKSGFIFEPGDKEALKAIIFSIMDNKIDEAQMGIESLALYNQKYSPEIVLNLLSNIYKKFN